MKNFTIRCWNGRYNNRWVVFTEWHGQQRAVFESPSVFSACRWVAQQKGAA